MKFNDLPWHDAIIESINMDRSDPGKQDILDLIVKWADKKNERSLVRFSDCYQVNLKMNFGIIAPESILLAELYESSENLNVLRKIWAKSGMNVKGIIHYRFETNSTNSVLEIFSCGFTEVKL